MNPDSTFKKVVLPEPVPPDTMMLSRVFTAALRYSIIAAVAPPNVMIWSGLSTSRPNLRIVRHGP